MMTMHMFWVLMVMMGFFVLLLGAALVAIRVLAASKDRNDNQQSPPEPRVTDSP